MVPADGPDGATPRNAVNLWGETISCVGILIQSLRIMLQRKFIKNSHGLECSIASSHPGQTLFLLQLSPVLDQQGVRSSTTTCRPHPRNRIQISTLLSMPSVLTLLDLHPHHLNNGCPLTRITLQEVSHPRRCLHNLEFHPDRFSKPHHPLLSKRSCLPRQNRNLQRCLKKQKKMSKFGRTNGRWRTPSLRAFRKDFMDF